MTMYRQGDILLIQLDKLPPLRWGERTIKADGIVQYGETTGHAHALHGAAALLEGPDKEAFVEVTGPATLDHEEHETIELPEGIYRVVRQREYTGEDPRYVRD